MLMTLSSWYVYVEDASLLPFMVLVGYWRSAALLVRNAFSCSVLYNNLGAVSPLVELQSILSSILSQYSVDHLENTIEDSLEKLKAVVGVLPLTSQLLAGSCPVELSIPMLFEGNTVGNAEACDLGIVEELKVEERNLFAIFLIGATIQDGSKRKEVLLIYVLTSTKYSCLYTINFRIYHL